MSKGGFIKKAVMAGVVVGALAGCVEAACLILYSKVYFPAGGKVGLLITATVLYAVYGAAATAILAGARLLFRSPRKERSAIAVAVFSMALLYSFSLLLSLGFLSGVSLFSVRLVVWVACLICVSLIVSYLAGVIVGALLKRRRVAIVVVCAVMAIGIGLFFPRGGESRRESDLPNVVLVTIDTIRADRLRCYGYDKIKTPVMDRLASEGVLFENTVCQIPITNPSHQSLLSSLYPHQTGVIDNWYRRPPGVITIVDEFKKHGYETAGFVSAFPLDSRFGFAEGFDVYDDDSSRIKGIQNLSLVRMADAVLRRMKSSRFARCLELKRDAWKTNIDVLSWLKSRAQSPFFLWVHYFDPHGPYVPPAPYSGMYYEGRKDDPDNHSMEGVKLKSYWTPDLVDFTDINYTVAQYDAEITSVDAELGKLLGALDEQAGDYIVVVVGDHGESLTEHGTYFHHGAELYEEQIMVPLIIRQRASIEPARVPALVENIDVAPTILELAGLAVPESFQGESLLPLMKGETRRKEKGVLSETGGRRQDGTIDIAYRTDRYKFIMKKPEDDVELYDLEKDPQELHDISGEREDLVQEFREKISSIIEEQVREASEVLDYETEEKLRSLGYLQ